MAVLILDEKCLVLHDKNYLRELKNITGFHQRPVTPSTANEAPLNKGLAISIRFYFLNGDMIKLPLTKDYYPSIFGN